MVPLVWVEDPFSAHNIFLTQICYYIYYDGADIEEVCYSTNSTDGSLHV